MSELGNTPVVIPKQTIGADFLNCRKAPAPEYPGLRWTPDACANAVFGPEVVEERLHHIGVGYLRARTTDPVRMSLGHAPNVERCTYQAAYWALDEERYLIVAGCGEQQGGEPYRTEGRAFVPRLDGETDSTRQLRPGYTYWAVSYPTPAWTEAIFGAPLERCRGGPV